MSHFRVIYIILYNYYNYWCINVFVTWMLQLLKAELTLTTSYTAGYFSYIIYWLYFVSIMRIFLYNLGSQRPWIPPDVVWAPPSTGVFSFPWHTGAAWVHWNILPHSVLSPVAEWGVFYVQISCYVHGAITFVSCLYAGPMSDREIFKPPSQTRSRQTLQLRLT